jgi:beta-lactamase regulating signal transducer with metallopeptidase domain/tetratricopeptide (TPR) repeat protein
MANAFERWDMSDLWFSSAGWFTQTALAGGFVLALGWLLARRAAPEATRSVAGWSVRGAVLASGLCLFPGWITLPAPDWAKPAPAPLATAPAVATPDVVAVADPTSTDVVRGDDGSWVIVDVPAEEMVASATSANWAGPGRETKGIELTVPSAEAVPAPVPEPRPVRGLVEDVARVVLVAYGFGLTFALGQLLLAQVALGRIVAAGSRAPGRVQELFAEAADRAGVRARLLLSNRVASPVCFGLWSPTVVLPKHLAQTAYDDELKWVFAHELDHLRRGDHRLAWWVGVARALYYFVPSFWAVRRQLGLAQEYLADAAAAATGHPADYAQFLVTLSSAPIDRRAGRHPLTATGVRAGRSDLFRRVNMLVNAAHSPTKPSRIGTTLAGGVTVGAAVLLSGFGFAADDPKKADAPPAESTSEKVPVAADDKADKAAAEAKARADEARAIARKAQAAAEAAARDAERAQADAVRAAREASRGETTTRNVLTARVAEGHAKEIEALKKAIAEAAKKGDAEAVNAAAEKLAKLAAAPSARPMTVTGRLAEAPKPPAVPPVPRASAAPKPPAPPTVLKTWSGPTSDALKGAHEQAIKQFKAAMDKVKDNPEAKAEFEKAIAEFQKAMEKAKKEMPQALEWVAPKFEGQNFKVLDGKEFKFVPFQGQGTFTTTAGGEGGRLGVSIAPVSPEDVEKLGLTKGVGVKVIEVRKDTAAEKAGIKKDDIILELAGKTIPGEPEDVVKLLAKVEKDAKVNVIILRDGKKETIKNVVLAEAKPAKVRVLETLKDGEHAPHVFDMKINPLDEKQLKLHIEQLYKQIEDLHKVAPKAGGKVEGKNVQMSVSVNDGDYTINAKKDGVSYDIKGTADGGPSSIVIKDGDKTVKAASVEKLPEAYRDDVKKMLGQVKISKDQK